MLIIIIIIIIIIINPSRPYHLSPYSVCSTSSIEFIINEEDLLKIMQIGN
jgi:hypothetical protein